MKMQVLAAMGAAMLLSGCNSADEAAPGDEATAEAAAPAEEAAAPADAAPAAGEKPTREFVVGKWGTDGDCTLAMDLRADGTSDGPFGNWSYEDGAITFADAPELKIDVTVLDEKTMESDNGGGKKGKMTRC